MTVYAIAQLKFTDRDAYNRYQAAFMEVFQQYSGTLLAADEAREFLRDMIRFESTRLVMNNCCCSCADANASDQFTPRICSERSTLPLERRTSIAT